MKDDHLYRDFYSGTMEEVYTTLYPALISYATKVLGYDYAFLAEDCVQDSIYKTYINRKQIVTTEQLKSYLYTAVRNKAISILRKGSSKKNFLKAAEISETDFTTELIEQETLRLLFTAIDNLPEQYRTLVEMSFEEGLKNGEIAKIMGISESAVKKRKARILENLRNSIKDKIQLETIILYLFASGFFE